MAVAVKVGVVAVVCVGVVIVGVPDGDDAAEEGKPVVIGDETNPFSKVGSS